MIISNLPSLSLSLSLSLSQPDKIFIIITLPTAISHESSNFVIKTMITRSLGCSLRKQKNKFPKTEEKTRTESHPLDPPRNTKFTDMHVPFCEPMSVLDNPSLLARSVCPFLPFPVPWWWYAKFETETANWTGEKQKKKKKIPKNQRYARLFAIKLDWMTNENCSQIRCNGA